MSLLLEMFFNSFVSPKKCSWILPLIFCIRLGYRALVDGERAIALAPQWATGYYRKGSALAGLKVGIYAHTTTGFEINARPLARGDSKPRGMSRIFAQVVRRASGYFNLFCQLCVTMNETNYWNLTRKSIKIITKTVWLEPSSLSWTCRLLSNMMDCPTLFWQRYLDFPSVGGNAASPAATPPGPRHGVGNLPN